MGELGTLAAHRLAGTICVRKPKNNASSIYGCRELAKRNVDALACAIQIGNSGLGLSIAMTHAPWRPLVFALGPLARGADPAGS